MKFDSEIVAAHAQFGGDLEDMQVRYNYSRLSDAIRPKLSKAARERVEELIDAEYAVNDSQVATDIQFLLDYHDKVHAAAEGE